MPTAGIRWAALVSGLIMSVAFMLWAGTPQVGAAPPAPNLTAPADGVTLADFGLRLAWALPAGARQVQVQVIPANNDGPGVDLIEAASSEFVLPPPPSAYVLLPGMSYQWRVRAADGAAAWGPWSEFRTFRTPVPSAAAAEPLFPGYSALLDRTVPITLRWTHPDPSLFYWELQVSGDARFDADPASATSFVWQNLVHGGASDPPNSWRTPPLLPGESYYWRVRPRVQGDGTPAAWSPTYSFVVAASPFGAAGLDVRQFGANGDGQTDDQPALDAAISAASAAGGGTVLLPPGAYRIGRTVHLRSNVTLRGAGMGATVIKSGELPADDPLAGYTTRTQIRGVGVHNVTVSNLSIVCETPTEQAGISFDEHSVNVRVSDVEALGHSKPPLRAVGGTRSIWFINNYVHDTRPAGTGILIDSFHRDTTIRDVFITGNRVDNASPDSAQGGISVWVANGASVSDVIIAHNIVTNTKANSISPGRGIGIYHHIGAMSTKRVTISHNTTTGNAADGLYVEAHIGAISQISVTGNISTRNGGAGVALVSTGGDQGGVLTDLTLQNNILTDNAVAPVSFQSLNGATTWRIGNNVGLPGSDYFGRDEGMSAIANGAVISSRVVGRPTRYGVTATVPGRIVAVTAAGTDANGRGVITVRLTDRTGAPVTTPELVSWWMATR